MAKKRDGGDGCGVGEGQHYQLRSLVSWRECCRAEDWELADEKSRDKTDGFKDRSVGMKEWRRVVKDKE